jgi:hypothetical protein
MPMRISGHACSLSRVSRKASTDQRPLLSSRDNCQLVDVHVRGVALCSQNSDLKLSTYVHLVVMHSPIFQELRLLSNTGLEVLG